MNAAVARVGHPVPHLADDPAALLLDHRPADGELGHGVARIGRHRLADPRSDGLAPVHRAVEVLDVLGVVSEEVRPWAPVAGAACFCGHPLVRLERLLQLLPGPAGHTWYPRTRSDERFSDTQSAVRRRPSSNGISGFHPAHSRARVLSHSRRSTSLPVGRSRSSSVTTSTSRPTIDINSFTRSPMEISRPEPMLTTLPRAASDEATAMKPAAVSSTKLKSRVGEVDPKWSLSTPPMSWARIVGITAG